MPLTDPELKCFMALQEMSADMLPGESAVDAVLRIIKQTDALVRPYRYPAVDGLHPAFHAWFSVWPRRSLHLDPSGFISADIFNSFQAGFTARPTEE